MSFFDENEIENNGEAPNAEDPRDNTVTEGAGDAATPDAEPERSAEPVSEASEEPVSETVAKPTPAPERGASVAYEPSSHYTPHTGSYYGGGNFRNTYEEEKKREERSRRLRNGFLASVLAFALLVTAVFGGVLIGKMSDGPSTPGTTTGQSTGGNSQQPAIDRGELSISVVEREAPLTDGTVPSVVASVKDTVVEIRTETTVNSPYYGEYVESGAGSGVIISSDGLILTCHHVIDGGETVHVVLTDGSTYVAEVYGSDSWSDLALIKIEATGLPYAELAMPTEENSENIYSYMAVGEQVVAIGNPLGELGGSVTTGIISALGRSVTVAGVPMTLMQIDASVNPGNSGGGLFNMDGNLIGIVNAKSSGESIEGIGFAIPSVDAFDIVKQLYNQGYVSGRPYLGIYVSSNMQIQSYEFNDELTGEYKIQAGDVLYLVEGTVLEDFSALKTVLAYKNVGDKVKIQVVRYVQSGRGYVQKLIEFELTVHEYIPSAASDEKTAG